MESEKPESNQSIVSDQASNGFIDHLGGGSGKNLERLKMIFTDEQQQIYQRAKLLKAPKASEVPIFWGQRGLKVIKAFRRGLWMRVGNEWGINGRVDF